MKVDKANKNSTKFIKPILLTSPSLNKTDKSIKHINNSPIANSRNNVLSPTNKILLSPHSKFTSIYHNYHLIYSDFIKRNKDQTTSRLKLNKDKSKMLINNKIKKQVPIRLNQKKDGLTRIPNTSIDPGIITGKLNEIVVHSVIANRRVEYSNKLKIERLKYINKVIRIQRKWRKWHKKKLIKCVNCIRRVYKKHLLKRKINNVTQFESHIKIFAIKHCMKVFKDYQVVSMKSNDNNNNQLEANQVDDTLCNGNIIPHEIGLKAESALNKVNNKHFEALSNVNDIEKDEDEEDDIIINNDEEEEDIIIETEHQPDSHAISVMKYTVNNKIQSAYFTKVNYTSKPTSISFTKLIQRCYLKHFKTTKLRFLKRKFAILFILVIHIIMNHKLIIKIGRALFAHCSNSNSTQNLINIHNENNKTFNNNQLQEEETNVQETEKELSLPKESQPTLIEKKPNPQDWKNVLHNIKEQILSDTFTSFSKFNIRQNSTSSVMSNESYYY